MIEHPPWMPGGVCCARCDTDTHRCPGCGDPLPHGEEVCDPCNDAAAFVRNAEAGQ